MLYVSKLNNTFRSLTLCCATLILSAFELNNWSNQLLLALTTWKTGFLHNIHFRIIVAAVSTDY